MRPQKEKHLWRIWRRSALAVLLALFAAGMAWFACLWQKIDQSIQQAGPSKADVGIVLGAAVWGEQPSPSLRERLDEALKLYEEGYVPVLLVTGGKGEGKTVTEAQVMREYLLAHNVPADAILLEEEAGNTYENLLFSQQVMEAHGLKSALLISHDFHLARAAEIAAALELPASPVGVKSRYLPETYYRLREVLALAYWQLTRMFS
jgi:uncharacterized SAM-binding protein YcdF (DUF218 family)